MTFPEPFSDAGTIPGERAAKAGFFLVGAGGAYVPVTAVYACHEGRVAFRAPQVSAHAAQTHRGIVDAVHVGTVHRVRVTTMWTRTCHNASV